MVILKKERISISFSLNIQCRYLAHISNPPLFYRAADFLFLSNSQRDIMQLDTPKLVRMALMIAAKVCKMNFQVSFFIIFPPIFFDSRGSRALDPLEMVNGK